MVDTGEEGSNRRLLALLPILSSLIGAPELRLFVMDALMWRKALLDAPAFLTVDSDLGVKNLVNDRGVIVGGFFGLACRLP